MASYKRTSVLWILVLSWVITLHALGTEFQKQVLTQDRDLIDFEDPNTFIDISDALRSKQYIHRTILNTTIKYTSQFGFERMYINHLMGFSSVWQRKSPVIKYITGLQGLSVGYLMKGGHGFELGLEFSAVSNANIAYKYVLKTDGFYSLWPYFGVGFGMETTFLRFAESVERAQRYQGTEMMTQVLMGLMIPLVDVGLKAEIRANFYMLDRLIFTQSIGAIIFL